MQKKKIWFITGISRGLGKALAEQALHRGDTVIGTTRSGHAEIESGPGRLLVLPLDVTNREQVFATVRRAYELNWRLDVIVNNAGYGLLGAMEETNPEEFHQVMDANFFGTVNVIQAALPYLRDQRSGHILNLSSIAGLAPAGGYSFYAAAKFAIEGLSTALAQEVRELGIKVTVVEPGAFRTDFLNQSSLKLTTRKIEAYAPLVGPVLDRLAAMNGQQPGDPLRAAEAILKVVDHQQPPLHLVLGTDALSRASVGITAMSEELNRWQSISLSTDYPTLVAS
jgi:NAD(P)-dependent dehydrogenase (short-subunit alcohol dehydrogenase family)